MSSAAARAEIGSRSLELARVLLVESDVASRLTLQTLLRASGYAVDVAASAADAICKMDASTYELVLTDPNIESRETGRGILAYARRKDYKPATAIIHAHRDGNAREYSKNTKMLVETEDVTTFLGKVAELISLRATRRSGRALRMSANN